MRRRNRKSGAQVCARIRPVGPALERLFQGRDIVPQNDLYRDQLIAATPAQLLRRVAGFLGITDQNGAIDIAIRQAGIEFMRNHGRQFDDHLIHDARDAASGLPPGTHASKLGSGSERQTLTPALRMLLDDVWRNEIKTTLGYASYPDMRAALNVNSLAKH